VAPEPRLELEDIQGHSLAGFRQDHQAYVFLRVDDPRRARKWLARLGPSVASARQVLDHNRRFSERRRELGHDPPDLGATWRNVAFTAEGLRRLAPASEVDRFADEAFVEGLAERSSLLGDPSDERAPGNRRNWLVGGTPATTPHLVVIAASDDADRRDAEVEAIVREAAGCAVVHTQRGDNPPGPMAGHEHFGFRDGISQPAVRGLGIAARPGQALVWPGQIVFGYPMQDRTDPRAPREAPLPGPAWCRNGSFVVIRRLRQDVAGFWTAVRRRAGRLGMDPVRLAAVLVGRWPSGAPVLLAPDADDPALAADPARNNDFRYAAQDPAGAACPFAAHIRKVNPRDVATEQGGANDTLARLFLRRGIQYGPALADPTAARRDDGVDRGLMFVAFMTSIVSQFEFFPVFWLNATDAPERAGGGHDPLIGQEEDRRGNRTRRLQLPAPTGGRPATLRFARDFVTPTGGGYFFAPSLTALRDVLAG